MTDLNNTTAMPEVAPTKADLSAITTAARSFAKQRETVRALIIAAGAKRKDVRDAFYAGYLVGYMQTTGGQPDYTLKQAKAALAGCGHGRTADGKVARTEREEKGYGACRVAWTYATRDIDAPNEETRGGARPNAGDTQQPETVVPVAPTAKDAMAHVDLQVASLLAYIEKNVTLPNFYGTALLTAADTIAKGKAAMTK